MVRGDACGAGSIGSRLWPSSQVAAATTATARAPRSGQRSDRRADAAVSGASRADSDSSFTSSSSTFRSAAIWKRRAGSLRKQRKMIRSSSFGTTAATWLGGLGSSFSTAAKVKAGESPQNARRPVTIS